VALQEEVVWLCRYRSEVQRLRNVFRSAVAGDVARLKEAVGEYKENTSRLECQKQLLLKQVSGLCSGLCCAVLHAVLCCAVLGCCLKSTRRTPAGLSARSSCC